MLSDGEQRIAGWTLLSPVERNVRLSAKMEEKILLMVRCQPKAELTRQSKQALYVVSFNYPLEKVVEFTRVPLESITSIQQGQSVPIQMFTAVHLQAPIYSRHCKKLDAMSQRTTAFASNSPLSMRRRATARIPSETSGLPCLRAHQAVARRPHHRRPRLASSALLSIRIALSFSPSRYSRESLFLEAHP